MDSMVAYAVESLLVFCGWRNEKERKKFNKVWSLPFMNLLGSEKFQELMLNVYVFDVDHDITCVHNNITPSGQQGKEKGGVCSLEKLELRIIGTNWRHE